MKFRLATMIVAVAAIASACSAAADPEVEPEVDPQAYCNALRMMYETQPAGVIGDDLPAVMERYAVTIEAASELAPDDQSASLQDLAQFARDVGADPTGEGLTERAIAMVGAMFQVEQYATNECGIDTEGFFDAEGDPDSTDDIPPLRTDIEEIPADVVAEVNAKVPPRLELEFASFRTTDDEEFPALVLAPVGWDVDDFLGTTFDPPVESELGFFTDLSVGAHCSGICAPRAWEDTMKDLTSGPFSGLRDSEAVLRDEPLANPTGRVVVYRRDSSIHPIEVIVTRWDDRAKRYFKCNAELDEDDVDLWEMFAAACEAAIPLWLPAS